MFRNGLEALEMLPKTFVSLLFIRNAASRFESVHVFRRSFHERAIARSGKFVLRVPLVIITGWLIIVGRAPADEPLSNRIASYWIQARLLPDRRGVEGRETLVWKNASVKPVKEIFLHLYPNAYRNSLSTFAREGQMTIAAERAGWIDIKSVTLKDGMNLLPELRYVHPDDDNADDRTVARISLPEEVLPGGEIAIIFEFFTRIPKQLGRSSYALGREFYFVSQWFPKIGVLETEGKWNCHQFHRFTEFFSDFGFYHVELTVPANFIVGATGVRVGTRKNLDGTITYTYEQGDIHDFAWTASPDFIQVERVLNAPPLPPTRIILLLQPEHRDQMNRHLHAIEAALRAFGTAYGPYPYPTLTVVDPPRTATSAGMEYPTLIVTGTNTFLLEKVQSPEYIIFHEFGHQYWYGMVASNEFEEPWLDEGFTSYTAARALLDTYGPNISSFRIAGIPFYGYPILSYHGFPLIALLEKIPVPYPLWRFPLYLENASNDPIEKLAWKYYDYATYRVNAYNKPEIMLFTLERILGRSTMDKVLRAYFTRWRFRHPRGEDFIRVAEEVTGMDLSWFFNPLVSSTGVVDYGVKAIEVRHIDAKAVESSVTLWRYGEVKFPVEVAIRFADGTKLDTVWDGQARWTKLTFVNHSPAVSAAVDPEHKILLDVNITNNTRQARTNPWGAIRWASKWFFWMQNLLQIVSTIS